MLNYDIIHKTRQARHRLAHHAYSRPRWDGDASATRDSDKVLLFTWETKAIEASQANVDWAIAVARDYDQDLLVIKPYTIQVAGRTYARQAADKLFSRDWLIDHNDWLGSATGIRPQLDETNRGHMAGLYTYRACMCLAEHQGVYDVTTGQRMTNRRAIISRMWDLGFAANRGRPLAMARPRQTGTREDLELITELADRYWERRYENEATKKLVSAYRSINRYAAWPGAW